VGQKQPSMAESAKPAAYREASSAALVFDTPITEGQYHPELARAPRENAAYLGYQDTTVESYITATDDLQGGPWGDAYVKESITVKSGSRVR
jgi:hypothetical protein